MYSESPLPLPKLGSSHQTPARMMRSCSVGFRHHRVSRTEAFDRTKHPQRTHCLRGGQPSRFWWRTCLAVEAPCWSTFTTYVSECEARPRAWCSFCLSTSNLGRHYAWRPPQLKTAGNGNPDKCKPVSSEKRQSLSCRQTCLACTERRLGVGLG